MIGELGFIDFIWSMQVGERLFGSFQKMHRIELSRKILCVGLSAMVLGYWDIVKFLLTECGCCCSRLVMRYGP